MTEEKPVSDQVAMGFMEIAICLAQALHEADPGVAQRMNFAAGLSYNRLVSEGQQTAADIVYAFGRSLMNRDLFPVEESPLDSESV
jgi:hypothetical protein